MKHEFGYGSKCESLNGEKWEINNEGRDDIGRSTVGIMRSFPNENEPFLDESWDSIIGGEEDQANSKDVEVQKSVYVFEGFRMKVIE